LAIFRPGACLKSGRFPESALIHRQQKFPGDQLGLPPQITRAPD
jgi:hypothetical protein